MLKVSIKNIPFGPAAPSAGPFLLPNLHSARRAGSRQQEVPRHCATYSLAALPRAHQLGRPRRRAALVARRQTFAYQTRARPVLAGLKWLDLKNGADRI